ncbi:MAG: xanthine dehydrogenase family protein subunit M [Clostridiales bacterium]|nr:xanthine dehydrogenase family protein subunit M [Clostridiales bacterium]
MSRIQLNKFMYFEPDTVRETTEVLDKYGDDAKVIAGGIDLLPKMRTGSIKAGCLVSVAGIPDLSYFRYDEKGGLEFGAMTTLQSLDTSEILKQHYPALQQAIHQITSVQSKYMGTAVGNLCVATPGSDVAPALMAYGAVLLIAGPSGERREEVCAFYPAKNKTTLGRGEFVTGVHVSAPAKGTGAAFINRVRTHADIAKITLTVALTVDGDICREARIAMGAVAPVPVRAEKAEGLLKGRAFSEGLAYEAAAAVVCSMDPSTGLRSTKEYRTEVTPVLVERALHKAFENARRAE